MRQALREMLVLLAGALLVAPVSLWASVRSPQKPQDLAKRVRHELVMLPYYNVFDNLSFKVEGDRVTLSGQVTDPVLRTDAGRVVQRMPGVAAVSNQIEVLPLSPYDDHLRIALLRAIYWDSALSRYGLNPVSPIRIVVKNGNVTLEGVVASTMDRNIAGIKANQVPGVFAVTNNLRVESA